MSRPQHRVTALLFAFTALGPITVWLMILGIGDPLHPFDDLAGKVLRGLTGPAAWFLVPLAAVPPACTVLTFAHWRVQSDASPTPRWMTALAWASLTASLVAWSPAVVTAGLALYHGSSARFASRLPRRAARAVRVLAVLIATGLLVISCGLVIYQGSELYKKAAIRGWIPGATRVEHIVTAKYVVRNNRGPEYWVAWSGADIAQQLQMRVELEEEQWRAISVGEALVIAHFGKDAKPYKPDGFHASEGELLFDLALIVGTLLVVAALLPALAGAWKALADWLRSRSRKVAASSVAPEQAG